MTDQLDSLLGEGEGLKEFRDGLPPGPIRSDNFSLETYTDPKQLIRWMNKTRKMPLEAIDSASVLQGYAAIVWEFRAAALSGNLKATKSLEAWLTWAKPIISQMANRDKPQNVSKGSVAFLPREPDKAESEDVAGDEE